MPTSHEGLTLGTNRLGTAGHTALAALDPRCGPVQLQAAGELLLCRQRLDAVTTILGGWIWETDTEHRFTYMSSSVTRYTSRAPEWHYGKTRQELGNLSVKTTDGRSWVEQLDARQNFGPVDFLRYQGSNALWMRTIGVPQFDSARQFTGYCGIAFELPTETETEASERRAEPRRRIVRAAEISVQGAASPTSCVMVDISTTGARVHVPNDAPLPATVRLKVEALTLDVLCAVRWRRNDEVGLEFIE